MNDGGSGNRFTFVLLGAQRVRQRRSTQDAKAAKPCNEATTELLNIIGLETVSKNFALLRVCPGPTCAKVRPATFMAITINAAVSSLITNRGVVAWIAVILCRNVRLECEISVACGNNCVCVMNDEIVEILQPFCGCLNGVLWCRAVFHMGAQHLPFTGSPS